MKTFFFAAFLIVSASTFACSCIQPPKIENVVESAELILQGKVIQHFDDKRNNFTVNRVLKVLKDEVKLKSYFENNFRIQIFNSSISSASCGINLKEVAGTEYLIIFPKLEKSEFGYAHPPQFSNINSCEHYLYVINRGPTADQYRYIKSLILDK